MILPREIFVDSFAGGGGASSGIERALGRKSHLIRRAFDRVQATALQPDLFGGMPA